jgi:hypothetical protein
LTYLSFVVHTRTMPVTNRTTNDLLLAKLLEKQGKLSDYKFAAILGVPRSSWINTRLKERPIGITLLKAIVQTYPELNADVLDYLRGENHDDSDTTK